MFNLFLRPPVPKLYCEKNKHKFYIPLGKYTNKFKFVNGC